MELFSIHCTTCKARLKVNDESAIGQILSCPKCQSMVQVVPPVDWQRPSAATMVTAIGPTSAPVAQSAPGSQPGVRAAWSAENNPPPLPSPAATAVASSPPGVAASGNLSAVVQAVVAFARRDWLALTGGVVLGSGVWLAIALTSSNDPPASKAVESVAAPPRSQRDIALQDVEPTLPAEPEETGPDGLAVEPAEPMPAESITPMANDEPDAPRATPAAFVEPPPAAAPATPSPTVRLDPAPAVAAPAVEPDPAERGTATQVDQPPAEPRIGAVPDRPGQSPGATSRMLSKSEIEDRLTQPLPALEFPTTTLVKFVDFMHDLTGVTITIDEAALAKSGHDRHSPLSLKLSETTAGEALRSGAQHLGLQVVVQGGKIVLTAPHN